MLYLKWVAINEKRKNKLVDLELIKKILPSNLLPSTYEGIVSSIDEKPTKEGGRSLHITVELVTPEKYKGELTVIMIRLPKALTGMGQGDLLLKYMRAMGYTNTDMLLNNAYVFEKHSLKELMKSTGRNIPASFTEHPRHYPVRAIEQPQPDEPA